MSWENVDVSAQLSKKENKRNLKSWETERKQAERQMLTKLKTLKFRSYISYIY